MYVCLCNGFTERDVRRVLSQGANSPSGVYRALNCGPQCGRCKGHIHSLIEEYRRRGTGPAPGNARPEPVSS